MKKTLAIMVISLASCSLLRAGESSYSPSWAMPIALEGLPNLHKVSGDLYRSAQPSALGMQNLTNLGIKTVINLRTFHSDEGAMAGVPINQVHIWMKTWHAEREDVLRFLQVVTDPTNTPVLVHCQHGADRTGLMCAMYRIVVQGWSKEAAIKEMTEGDFGFHEMWGNLPKWIDEVEVEELKEALKEK